MIIFSLWGMIGIQSVMAQRFTSFFQPLGWEQASLIAARENKLVMVEVGETNVNIERGLQKHPELMNYLSRGLVAIHLDMNSIQGQQFEPRLLMYPHPTIAFFMPYGDLVGIVTPDRVKQNLETLRETLEKAREKAKIKKMNSRSIVFANQGLQEVLEEAEQADKLVGVYLSEEKNQLSLLLERDVFNLDRVADFYNQNFVNIRLNAGQNKDVCQKYGVRELPAYLFLNAKGKLLHQIQGYAEAEQMVQQGEKALEKAKGISFQPLALEQARLLAQERGKMIFADYYMAGSAHKEMVRNLFTDPEVTDFFEEHFINVNSETDQPALVFMDANGNELHRIVKVEDSDELLKEARRVIEGKGLLVMQQAYMKGNKEADFLEEYMKMLYRAGRKAEAAEVSLVYFSLMSPDCLKQRKYWDLFDLYGLNVSSVYFDYVLNHRNDLYALYGEKKVREKVAALWIAGAENFVKNGKFDDVGFKAYAKRLKKEKVEGARLIIRNARMHAAEKVGDWKTYITLAEEKWNEEQISDAELYSWGMKINEHCFDEGLRYKMAQWLAAKVMEIEQKEKISGKVKVASYRGFLEKLVDDLLKK